MDIRQLTGTCVHCGLCLPACPTYQLWGTEADSPRGRIHLVDQMAAGLAEPAEVAGHLDTCLGCLACLPACPAEVRYDDIIEAGRALVATGTGRDRAGRTGLSGLLAYPRRSGPAGPVEPAGRPVALPPRVRARGRPRRAVVGLLAGCRPDPVRAATARVLAREGCDVLVPPGPACCGGLAVQAGRRDEARRLARRTIARFARAGVDMVVTDAAGCGTAMKRYAGLLADDPRWAGRAARFAAGVRDVTEFLVELGPEQAYRPLELTVAYHDACELGYGQGVRSAPRRLLGLIPSLQVVEVPDAGTCCGAPGAYHLRQPGAAGELGDRVAAPIVSLSPDLVAVGDAGCLAQISAALVRAGSLVPVRHTIELLDAALRPST